MIGHHADVCAVPSQGPLPRKLVVQIGSKACTWGGRGVLSALGLLTVR